MRFFWLGLILIASYWVWVHPADFGRLGYVEDIGGLETVRQMMAENLVRYGRPVFKTDQFMAPFGASNPFMSWSIERDGIGALFWLWNPEFPFFWFYFGASLVLTYAGVAFFLRKMKFGNGAAWMFAAFVVLMHVPRHFKIWHHFEHLPEHWLYLGIFFDAWIWWRFTREKRWSWTLEIWRGFVLMGVLMSTGYFWGPMILEWAVVRAFLLAGLARDRVGEKSVAIEGTVRSAVAPALLCVGLGAIEGIWFYGLFEEIRGIKDVYQPMGWFASLSRALQPLWFERLIEPLYWVFRRMPRLTPIDTPETVVTVGWVYWAPFIAGLGLMRRKKGGPGIWNLAPFLFYFLVIFFFIRSGWPHSYHAWIRDHVPFMSYFRVASRMGLFFPIVMGALIALSWPELSRWVRERWEAGSKQVRGAMVAFVALSLLEATWLFHPVNMMPSIPPDLGALLDGVRDSPGNMVLDLPFCVAGGNGVCTGEQCPNYPYSTAGIAFRAWHFKNVHGLYQARMLPEHCQIYNREPYVRWFDAWRRQRCFTPEEWKGFCGYLDSYPNLSAVLLYPDIWVGANRPECRDQFEQYLGPAKGEARFFSKPTRGGAGSNPTRVRWFGPKCIQAPALTRPAPSR